MAVRQWDAVLGANKQTVRATKQTVSAPGGGVVVRLIVDDSNLALAGGKNAILAALRQLESVIREQTLPLA
jgi:hypothetical protein